LAVKYQRHDARQSEFDHYQEHHLREEWFGADNYELRLNYSISLREKATINVATQKKYQDTRLEVSN
jgi:hypothetical protein